MCTRCESLAVGAITRNKHIHISVHWRDRLINPATLVIIVHTS